jgi:hypothetical protein
LASKALSSASNMFLSERTSRCCCCVSWVASTTMAAKANRQAAPAAMRLTAVDVPPCNDRTEAGQEVVSHSPPAVMRRPRCPLQPSNSSKFPSLLSAFLPLPPPPPPKGWRQAIWPARGRTWPSKISHEAHRSAKTRVLQSGPPAGWPFDAHAPWLGAPLARPLL